MKYLLRKGDCGEDYCGEKAQKKGSGSRFFQPFFFVSAEALGNNDGKAVGQTLQKADEQSADGCGGADCGERGFPQCASHDPCVSQAVKELEQIAETHRQGKGEHKFGWVSLSQILHILISN